MAKLETQHLGRPQPDFMTDSSILIYIVVYEATAVSRDGNIEFLGFFPSEESIRDEFRESRIPVQIERRTILVATRGQ